jgi:RNA polymerase primary sigma factor
VAQATELMRRVDELRRILVVEHLPFVAHVVREATGARVADVDLIQEGTLGLMKALDRFDHERGVRFATYAYWWIRKCIEPSLGNRHRLISLPDYVTRQIFALARTSRELYDKLGRPPSRAELAASLEQSPARIEWLMEKLRCELPLESPIQPGTTRGILLHTLSDSDSPDPLTWAIERQITERVEALLRHLRPSAREVIRLRFGLGSERPHTLHEVGLRLRRSRERVRQIEREALELLKRGLIRSGRGAGRKPRRRPRRSRGGPDSPETVVG